MTIRFYRVQSDESFTHWDSDGFTAMGRYWMDYCHWINRGKIECHLNWKDRSIEPTPFISIFDNLRDAEQRAELMRAGNNGVFIAEVVLPDPQQSTLEIDFSDRRVDLPALLHVDDKGTTTFLSTTDIIMWVHDSFTATYALPFRRRTFMGAVRLSFKATIPDTLKKMSRDLDVDVDLVLRLSFLHAVFDMTENCP
ncbi:uncharacterized protein UV8b_08166 [Ustilaginoidea virens]|uniref:DUF7587 domain-containing protein n=1 Tax=Ustilaginoidea virens TaxID=1159556 RepID=A0A8E5HYW2_USTVR|nr:uncharacterized protein UV8b_08166 [Ustilaginoidea virens]QUC23925.1 hypothetical protein UV8b_08166 [Ustilaginoidea virens]